MIEDSDSDSDEMPAAATGIAAAAAAAATAKAVSGGPSRRSLPASHGCVPRARRPGGHSKALPAREPFRS
jgi:hypothetical protein